MRNVDRKVRLPLYLEILDDLNEKFQENIERNVDKFKQSSNLKHEIYPDVLDSLGNPFRVECDDFGLTLKYLDKILISSHSADNDEQLSKSEILIESELGMGIIHINEDIILLEGLLAVLKNIRTKRLNKRY